MKALRKLPDNAPVKEQIVTLILNNALFACTYNEKTDMLETAKEGDVIVAVWQGKWQSHAFSCDLVQLKRMLTG